MKPGQADERLNLGRAEVCRIIKGLLEAANGSLLVARFLLGEGKKNQRNAPGAASMSFASGTWRNASWT